MVFNLRSAVQRIRNDHLKTEAEIQVNAEEKQPDNVSVVENLIISVNDRLLRADRTIPHPLTGSDKDVRLIDDPDDLPNRPGYYMAGEYPNMFIFLTFDNEGKGILVNKPDPYSPVSNKLEVDQIRNPTILNAIALRLRQIHAIPHEDFNTLPRKSWSWQVQP